jgi:hypothetical protein
MPNKGEKEGRTAVTYLGDQLIDVAEDHDVRIEGDNGAVLGQ